MEQLSLDPRIAPPTTPDGDVSASTAHLVLAPDGRCAPFRPSPERLRRFWSKVVKTDGCWWWTGAISAKTGYGCWAYYRDQVLGVHRAATMLDLGRYLRGGIHGEIAAHGCDEPLCVRVGDGHLYVTDAHGNVSDMVARSRRRGYVNDDRSAAGRSRAIRAAVLQAVADGSDVTAAAAAAAAAGGPLRDQQQLPL